MKLGIAAQLPHTSPDEWAMKHKELGLRAVVFPCNYKDAQTKIDSYLEACKVHDLAIAEIGSWGRNVLSADPAERSEAISQSVHQLELAEYVHADCCVSCSGAMGPVWDGPYPDNFSPKTYAKVVETTQQIIDAVNPKHTAYTLEPMPWMYPHTPENYLQLIKDINREGFGVHMDMINMISSPEKYLFNADYTKEAFALLGRYIKSCHIKDVAMSGKLTTLLKEVPCGEGGFDLKNYIQQIDLISPDMTVIIEHLEQMELYLKTIDYINELIKA